MNESCRYIMRAGAFRSAVRRLIDWQAKAFSGMREGEVIVLTVGGGHRPMYMGATANAFNVLLQLPVPHVKSQRKPSGMSFVSAFSALDICAFRDLIKDAPSNDAVIISYDDYQSIGYFRWRDKMICAQDLYKPTAYPGQALHVKWDAREVMFHTSLDRGECLNKLLQFMDSEQRLIPLRLKCVGGPIRAECVFNQASPIRLTLDCREVNVNIPYRPILEFFNIARTRKIVLDLYRAHCIAKVYLLRFQAGGAALYALGQHEY